MAGSWTNEMQRKFNRLVRITARARRLDKHFPVDIVRVELTRVNGEKVTLDSEALFELRHLAADLRWDLSADPDVLQTSLAVPA